MKDANSNCKQILANLICIRCASSSIVAVICYARHNGVTFFFDRDDRVDIRITAVFDDFGSDWIRLDQIGSDWIRMDQIGSDCIRLYQNGSDWIRLDQIGSDELRTN